MEKRGGEGGEERGRRGRRGGEEEEGERRGWGEGGLTGIIARHQSREAGGRCKH